MYLLKTSWGLIQRSLEKPLGMLGYYGAQWVSERLDLGHKQESELECGCLISTLLGLFSILFKVKLRYLFTMSINEKMTQIDFNTKFYRSILLIIFYVIIQS